MTNPVMGQAITGAFPFELFRQIAPSADQNAFFSPYSISTALAMTWAGAHGNTAAQMARVLHVDALPADQVAAAFGGLQKTLNDTGKKSGVQLTVANSLWPEQNPEIPLRPEYIKSVEDDFASAIFPMDFRTQAEAARQRINAWVEDKTNQRIQNLLAQGQVTPDTRLILVNAIYFKSNWAEKFDAQATAPAPFKLADGKTVSTPLMHKTFEHNAGYAEITDGPASLQILALPYQGDALQMLVLLPESPTGLTDLEKSLDSNVLDQWVNRLQWNDKVEVFLPKFKLNTRYELTPALQALGMTDAFDPRLADFSGMTTPSYLSISAVVHEAFVEVNEEGTEAAAATGVLMIGALAMAPHPTPVFRADHPFLFFIRDRDSGSILFMGRLAVPETAK